jgi:hypothetical protein
VPWIYLPMVGEPFAEFTWRHARRRADQAHGGHADEAAVAAEVAAMLARADRGPLPDADQQAADRRIVARTRAALYSPLAAALPAERDRVDDTSEVADAAEQPGGSDPGHADDDAPLPEGLFDVLDPAAETQGEPW